MTEEREAVVGQGGAKAGNLRSELYMKSRKILHGLFTGLLAVMLFGCNSGPSSSASSTAAGMDLDAAIREAAAQMEAKIPSGTMVALVSVASPSTAFSTQVLTRLESAIVSGGKLVVVDRANLDKVRAEQGFQLSGEVDDESAKSIGKLLGAGAIVTGSLADLGDVYSLTLKAINIETATVAVSYLADLAKSTRVETLLASGGGAAAGSQVVASTSPARMSAAAPTRAVQEPPPPAQAAPPDPAVPVSAVPTKEYKIGDTGPAGGIVFYDKGNNFDGWRYLEVAPANLGNAQWQSAPKDVKETKDTIGSGKQNTQLIGDDSRAALLCQQYSLGGFRDWFLPSKAELDLMYINLKMKDLGNFSDGWYWSSSDYTPDGWDGAWSQRFSDGFQEGAGVHNKTKIYSVRAVRQF